jgi:hypothetical protein
MVLCFWLFLFLFHLNVFAFVFAFSLFCFLFLYYFNTFRFSLCFIVFYLSSERKAGFCLCSKCCHYDATKRFCSESVSQSQHNKKCDCFFFGFCCCSSEPWFDLFFLSVVNFSPCCFFRYFEPSFAPFYTHLSFSSALFCCNPSHACFAFHTFRFTFSGFCIYIIFYTSSSSSCPLCCAAFF